MSLKRLIPAALATVLAAAMLSGCSTNASSSSTTVTFWTHTHPPMIAVYKKLIAQYQKDNPGVKIDYQTIPNSDFNTKMLTSLSNGSGPCVINMDDSALRGDYIPKGLLTPLDPQAFGAGSVSEVEKRYVDGTLDGAKGPDGTLYGLPSEYNATGFVINKAHFADAGLDPSKPPATWDEVAADAKKLAAAGHTQAFSFLYLAAGWYSQQLQTLLNQTGGTIADGKKGTLDAAKSEQALKLWADLARGPQRTADPNKTSREATQPFQDLATGIQSMAIVYPWAMDQIKATNPDTYKDLEVVPLPQVNADNPVNRAYGYFWAVNKGCTQQKASWKFVSFLSGHSKDFLTGASFVQPVSGWQDTDAAKKIPFIGVWSAAYAKGKFDEVTPNYSEVQDAIMKMVNDTVFDGVKADQSARQASDAVTRILGN